MSEYKPIGVTLQWRTRADGSDSIWPDFPALYAQNPSAFNGLKPGQFFKRFGIGGWHYNKISNLGTGADHGEAVCLIPKANADAILAAGIEGVRPLTETQLEVFWNIRAYVNQQDVFEDADVLQAIAAKVTIRAALSDTTAPDAQDVDAWNPDHPARGRRRNQRKLWARFKAAQDITIVE